MGRKRSDDDLNLLSLVWDINYEEEALKYYQKALGTVSSIPYLTESEKVKAKVSHPSPPFAKIHTQIFLPHPSKRGEGGGGGEGNLITANVINSN